MPLYSGLSRPEQSEPMAARRGLQPCPEGVDLNCMRDAATPQGGSGIIVRPTCFVGVIMLAGILAVLYGFTVDGMLRPDVGPP